MIFLLVISVCSWEEVRSGSLYSAIFNLGVTYMWAPLLVSAFSFSYFVSLGCCECPLVKPLCGRILRPEPSAPMTTLSSSHEEMLLLFQEYLRASNLLSTPLTLPLKRRGCLIKLCNGEKSHCPHLLYVFDLWLPWISSMLTYNYTYLH